MSIAAVSTSIIERINRWAIETPDFPCYEYQGDSLTYLDLKQKSDSLASFIASTVQSDLPILVYGHMSPLMLVSFLACSKSGHAYVPVDVSMPVERIKQIIDVANPALILATESFPLEMNELNSVLIHPEKVSELANSINGFTSKDCFVKGDSNYYIIFTSGSTGKPKGVQITHNNLQSFTDWIVTDFSLKEGSRFLNQAPFSFDLSVMDLYPALLTGGTIVPLDKTISGNLKDLYRAIPELKIDVWVSTPSFADLCLMDPNFSGETADSIAHFLFCGEVLTKGTAKELLGRFPNADIYNTYGPTEATVAVTSVQITDELIDQYPSLPLGAIKEDTILSIVDENDTILSDGEYGEIILNGPSVSKGYLNDEVKTFKSFYQQGNHMAYRTGDCGSIQDGLLFFRGRLDFQVKLHGYRIELEDIENNLKQVSYIHSCIVVPKMRENKVDSLVAFVIPTEHSFDKEYKLSAAIKKELADKMPGYMIPRKWIFKKEFPLTINSKIDRKKLADEVNE